MSNPTWTRERPIVAGWTSKLPTAAGWYWWRSQERSYEEVLMVLGDEKLGCPLFAMQDGEERALSRLGGEWLGPITPEMCMEVPNV